MSNITLYIVKRFLISAVFRFLDNKKFGFVVAVSGQSGERVRALLVTTLLLSWGHSLRRVGRIFVDM